MLDSAVEHYARQARITALGLIAARRARDQGDMDRLLAVVVGAQFAAAREAADAVPAMLEEQGVDAEPVAQVVPAGLVGVASDGRALGSLLELAETAEQFDRIVETQLQDVARNASSVAIAARPAVTGYVRMINPGACSRCVILAGKWFRWNQGFKRHPQCGCRHVPARENVAGDLATDPRVYFESLSAAEQDKAFTRSGAEAIRDGADIAKVVNANRSGMATAQTVHGVEMQVTRESMTARGDAKQAMDGRGVRLMPESIYKAADDRDDAIRLLRLYGYITD